MNENYGMPKHWQIKKLGEVCDVLDNLRKPINSTERQQRIAGKSQRELYPYYGATGQVGWIDSYLTDGDFILIGEDGAPFLDIYKDKAYKIKGKTWVNNHAHILKGKKEFILDDFALYYLNSINYREFVNGTTRLKLTKSNLIDIPFVVPPLPEQQAIVAKIEELLSDLENGKQQLQTAQQQLIVYRQSLLKWAFEGKLTNKKVKDGELPKGWKWVKLNDVCKIIGGVTKGKDLKGKASIHLPYLRVANVQDGYLDLRQIKTIEVLPSDKEKYQLLLGDILYTEGGDKDKLGRGTIWKNEIKDCIHQNHIFRARPLTKDINSKYIAYFSQTRAAKNYFFKHGKQTTNLASINLTILSNLPLPLCAIKEQQLIVDELESKLTVCDKIEETISQSLQQAETLRQSILKKAFEGKLINCELKITN